MPSTQRLRWLIASQTDRRSDVLTLDDAAGRILPVFSFREEAEMYALLQCGVSGWRPRVFSAGEIVSLLYGPLSDVTSVALDPLPEVCDRATLRLLCVRRRTFVRSLLDEGRGGYSQREHGTAAGIFSRGAPLTSYVAARGTAADPASLWPGARG